MSVRLPAPDALSLVQSSLRITSLADVVVGLLENSLNAQAGKIRATLHISEGSCSVEDDGLGILPGRLAQLNPSHNESAGPSFAPTDDMPSAKGTLLTSLATLAMLTITTKHHQHRSRNALTMRFGKLVSHSHQADHQPTVGLQRQGTIVVVTGLFENMPVRRQRQSHDTHLSSLEHEWLQIRRRIVALLLARNVHVDLLVRNASALNNPMTVNIKHSMNEREKTIALLSATAQLPCDVQSRFVSVQASTNFATVQGLISTIPISSRCLQFVSLNEQYHEKVEYSHTLLEHINKVFDRSDFGLDSGYPPSLEVRDNLYHRPTKKGLTKQQKGRDRWPVFHLRIRRADGEQSSQLDARSMAKLLTILDRLTYNFLRAHHFRPASGKQSNKTSDIDHPKHVKQPYVQLATNLDRQQQTLAPGDQWSYIKSGHRAFCTPLWSARTSTHEHKVKIDLNSKERGESDFVPELSSLRAAFFTRNASNISSPVGDRSASDSVTESNMELRLEHLPQAVSLDRAQPCTNRSLSLDSRTGMSISGTSLLENKSTSTIAQASATSWAKSGSKTFQTQTSQLRANAADGSWLQDFLQTWTNPCFPTKHPVPVESIEPSVATFSHDCHQSTTRRTKDRGIDRDDRIKLSKSQLREATIIAQIDRKYILTTFTPKSNSNRKILVLIDQHAASERCILEGLLSQMSESKLHPRPLRQPIVVSIPCIERARVVAVAPTMAQWGILYQVDTEGPSRPSTRITISSLPAPIAERCTTEPVLIERILRNEANRSAACLQGSNTRTFEEATMDDDQQGHRWVKHLGSCPKGIMELLNSRACRSAIMFNDILSLKDCRQLVANLADCAFPFICAHGRVSMVPLVNIDHEMTVDKETTKPSMVGAIRNWKTSMGCV